MEQFPQDSTAIQGESMEFQVKVTGTPQPKLTWYHNEKEIVADSSIKLAEDGTLTVLSVEARHEGVYKLVAENAAGILQKELELHVTEREYCNISSLKAVSGVVPVAMYKEYIDNIARGGLSEEHQVDGSITITPLFIDCNLLFQALYSGVEKTVSVASSERNKPCNRFPDICPCKCQYISSSGWPSIYY